MFANSVPTTLVRLITVYRAMSVLYVVCRPVRRPSTLLTLFVSLLERPSALVLPNQTGSVATLNRLIIPDSTRAAARVANRITPLAYILLLPPLLFFLFRGLSSARLVTGLRVFKISLILTSVGICTARLAFWGDLCPLIPLPEHLSGYPANRINNRVVDLSIQDLPRIALIRRGERHDLLFLILVYVCFVTLCVQGLISRQASVTR